VTTPGWIADLFPEAVVDATRLSWGFTNETWAVSLRDGRRLAVTRIGQAGSSAPATARLSAVRRVLASAGLPIPAPVLADAGGPWPADVRVSELVDGVAGAKLLADVDGARTVGRLCGAVARRLVTIDGSGLGLPGLWADPDRLVRECGRWVDSLSRDLGAEARARLRAACDDLGNALAGRTAVVAHGDLVPVNILVRDGRLVALLDLETIRLADPLFDAGWFDQIVRFHHPDVRRVAWAAFVAAAAIDPDEPVTRSLLGLLPMARILEIQAGLRPGDPARPRWIEQLQINRRWAGSIEPLI
jgi:aminoglycoside phosphotransferase (APT) family kinase protein